MEILSNRLLFILLPPPVPYSTIQLLPSQDNKSTEELDLFKDGARSQHSLDETLETLSNASDITPSASGGMSMWHLANMLEEGDVDKVVRIALIEINAPKFKFRTKEGFASDLARLSFAKPKYDENCREVLQGVGGEEAIEIYEEEIVRLKENRSIPNSTNSTGAEVEREVKVLVFDMDLTLSEEGQVPTRDGRCLHDHQDQTPKDILENRDSARFSQGEEEKGTSGGGGERRDPSVTTTINAEDEWGEIVWRRGTEVELDEQAFRKRYGGKVLGIRELIKFIPQFKFKVPEYDKIGTEIFNRFLEHNSITRSKIDEIYRQRSSDASAYEEVRYLFSTGDFSKEDETRLRQVFDKMRNQGWPVVAIRSSSELEDSEEYQFKGIYETKFLCFSADTERDFALFKTKVKMVYASIFSPKARYYRFDNNIPDKDNMGIAVHRVVGKAHQDQRFYPPLSGVTLFDPYNPNATISYINLGLNTKTVRGEYRHKQAYIMDTSGKRHYSGSFPYRGTYSGLHLTNYDYIALKIGMLIKNFEDLTSYHEYKKDKEEFLSKLKDGFEGMQFTKEFTLRMDEIARGISREIGRPVELEWSVDDNGEINIYQRRLSYAFRKFFQKEIELEDVPSERMIAQSDIVSGHKEVVGPLVIVSDISGAFDMSEIGRISLKRAEKLGCEGYILVINQEGLLTKIGGTSDSFMLSRYFPGMIGLLNVSDEPVPLAAHWSEPLIEKNIPTISTTKINQKLLNQLYNQQEKNIKYSISPVKMAVNGVKQIGQIYLPVNLLLQETLDDSNSRKVDFGKLKQDNQAQQTISEGEGVGLETSTTLRGSLSPEQTGTHPKAAPDEEKGTSGIGSGSSDIKITLQHFAGGKDELYVNEDSPLDSLPLDYCRPIGGRTYFGRDGYTLLYLVEQTIKGLAEGEDLNIFVMGASSGEEGYDIAIDIANYLDWQPRQFRNKFKTNLIISDKDSNAVEYAKRGIYKTVKADGRVREFGGLSPEECLYRYKKFFRPLNRNESRILTSQEFIDRWNIHIRFEVVDITDQEDISRVASGKKFNLIVARVVTYTSEDLAQSEKESAVNSVLDNIYGILKDKGIMSIGYGALPCKVEGRLKEASSSALTKQDIINYREFRRHHFTHDPFNPAIATLSLKLAHSLIEQLRESRQEYGYLEPSQNLTDVIDSLVERYDFYSDNVSIRAIGAVFAILLIDEGIDKDIRNFIFTWMRGYTGQHGGYPGALVYVLKSSYNYMLPEEHELLFSRVEEQMSKISPWEFDNRCFFSQIRHFAVAGSEAEESRVSAETYRLLGRIFKNFMEGYRLNRGEIDRIDCLNRFYEFTSRLLRYIEEYVRSTPSGEFVYRNISSAFQRIWGENGDGFNLAEEKQGQLSPKQTGTCPKAAPEEKNPTSGGGGMDKFAILSVKTQLGKEKGYDKKGFHARPAAYIARMINICKGLIKEKIGKDCDVFVHTTESMIERVKSLLLELLKK